MDYQFCNVCHFVWKWTGQEYCPHCDTLDIGAVDVLSDNARRNAYRAINALAMGQVSVAQFEANQARHGNSEYEQLWQSIINYRG